MRRVGLIVKQTALLLAVCSALLAQEKPLYQAEFLFPLEHWHNHSSSIVELPNGELFVCWFHGSGERQADDVQVLAARKPSAQGWSKPFLLADTPGFPDTNPTLFVDAKKRLWLFWPAILANEWETALMKYKLSTDYAGAGVPKWSQADNILLIPKRMPERTQQLVQRDLKSTPFGLHAQRLMAMASDKLSSRLGWFTRTHPLELPSGRMVLPLYSDGFSFSLMALSDDGGQSWFASEPIVGFGNIQPSVVRRWDGSLVAYMRDNGPPPKRIHQSISKDDGMTWTLAEDTTVPNPGTSVEAIALRDGRWVMVYNDLERGRHSLAISLSEDEGTTWKWTRHLEQQDSGKFHYPSVIQAQDGTLHVTYSYFTPPDSAGKETKSIKHVQLNAEWIKQGDAGGAPQ